MESKAIETHDPLKVARERVQVGPVPGWVDPAYYDKFFTPTIRGPITHLLIERQIHAELRQTFVRNAMRLESQQAVQNQSQWRLEFEPQTDSITLHSVKIRRGEVETEHAVLEKIQFLQRESGLEGYIIQGSITLLLLLEDVCPGDILEWSYTITRRPKLMPEYVTSFFYLPVGTEIGKLHFLALHAEGRPVKWKSSSPKIAPKITTENGEVRCYWLDAKFVSVDPEDFTPAGHIQFPWMQISDCPEWKTVVRAVLDAWQDDPPGDGLPRLIAQITDHSPDPLARINRAIEIVQDEFRYLSVDVGFGGHMPAQPEVVIRRRYGDCKDLAFLLVKLLRAIGVSARPVLVNMNLRQSVSSFLPAPEMFNHVVVEFEVGSEKRWVDATAKSQGGGALRRAISDFGVGLPIDAGASELVPVPKASLPSGTFDVKETFLLDTTGGSSHLAVLVTATGIHADSFRYEFANESLEAIAKKRLQACANQYSKAGYIGKLEYRDDRELNEFVIAEVFEIIGFIHEDKATQTCLVKIAGGLASGALALPSAATRRGPFALPFPCHRTHTVQIDFTGLNQISVPIVQTGNRFLTFNRRTRSWPKSLQVTFSLETLAGAVPPEEVPNLRKQVETIWQSASINVRLPSGYAKIRRRGDFGALPHKGPTPAVTAAQTTLLPEKPAPVAEGKIETVLQGDPSAKPMPPAADGRQFQAAPENSRPSHHRPRKLEKRCLVAFCFFLLALAMLVAAQPIARWNRGVAGKIALFVIIPSWICSLIFAAYGWKKFSRFPGRYADASKILVTITLALGGLLGLFFVPAMIVGVCRGVDAARGHYYYANGGDEIHPHSHDEVQTNSDNKVLDFSAENFVFHAPPRPWEQMDGTVFGTNTTVAFRRPEPMGFTIVAIRIPPMLLDPTKHLVELSKGSLQKEAGWHKVVNEREVVYNGVTGWQIETEGSLRGKDSYFVQWLCTTNGFGYQLTLWGPKKLKFDLLYESVELFPGFEPVAPQK